ncbi:beta-1,4-N-acetylgalactosaminyltransferase bre-4-like [Clytia hemisphaerica]|uniref:beta-1,4-N-acetylgalactosaminyltransferase bre-4-like n=1 Tax=Clytia hemisphaerica TaxID=252671 RepID=UPI0034D43956
MALMRKLKHGKWRLILAVVTIIFFILFLFSNISSKYQHRDVAQFLSSNVSDFGDKTTSSVLNHSLSTTKRTTLKRLTEKVFTEAKKKTLTFQQVGKLRALVQKYGVCLSKHFTEIAETLSSPSFYDTEEKLRKRCFVDMFGTSSGNVCKWPPRRLVGPLYVNFTAVSMEALYKTELSFVQVGGKWSPKDCASRQEVAIVIPFRDRDEHLAIFLRQMHSILRRQEYAYRILVIEQVDEYPFNRGKLMNVGFKEALKLSKAFSCFVFHDVDLIPEDDRNDYGCPTSPRHMSYAIDKFNYILPYPGIFGGVEAFLKVHFERVNGFPNDYWGWGAEDDCLYKRTIQNGFTLTRPSKQVGRYKMIKHASSKGAPPNRHDKLNNARAQFQTDGLSSLQYKVVGKEVRQLYTLIKVDLNLEGDAIY